MATVTTKTRPKTSYNSLRDFLAELKHFTNWCSLANLW